MENSFVEYRGFRTDDKGWVYGELIKNEDGIFILTSDKIKYSVYKNSVGQFTFLKDRNLKKIYVGHEVKNLSDETGFIELSSYDLCFYIVYKKHKVKFVTQGDVDFVKSIYITGNRFFQK